MGKSTKITVLFVLIFLVGVLLFVTSINLSLDSPSHETVEEPGESLPLTARP